MTVPVTMEEQEMAAAMPHGGRHLMTGREVEVLERAAAGAGLGRADYGKQAELRPAGQRVFEVEDEEIWRQLVNLNGSRLELWMKQWRAEVRG